MWSGSIMGIQRAIVFINLALIALGAYFGAGLFYQIWAPLSRLGQRQYYKPENWQDNY